MIRAWLAGREAEIVHVPDLRDPPNYVRHAEKFHGPSGTLFTTDLGTAELYRAADWNDYIHQAVRIGKVGESGPIQMLSTVMEEEAVIAALSVNVPLVVRPTDCREWLATKVVPHGDGWGPVG